MQQPREKLIQKGPSILSNYELLKVIIGSGNSQRRVDQIANDVLKLCESDMLTTEKLIKIKGIGSGKMTKIVASIELGRRLSNATTKRETIKTTEHVIRQVQDYTNRHQEHLLLLTVNGAYELIKKRVISVGTLNSTLIHPREIFYYCLKDVAAGFYLVHNHPSGNANPSISDQEITRQICEAGKLLGISLIDHIIVAENSHYSFKQYQLVS